MTKRLFKFLGVVLAGLPLGMPLSSAAASPYTSKYSDLDFEKCSLVLEESEIGFVQWKCPGAFGYDVYATEGDLRLYLAYKPEGYVPPASDDELAAETGEKNGDIVAGGMNADEMPTAEQIVDAESSGEEELGQTIPPFNNLGPKLEWRAPNRSGAAPFATIVRYHYQTPDEMGGFENGQILVVSRFRQGHSCHVAYIDARANESANLMAREVADKFAGGGNCPEGAVPVLGAGGDVLRF
jgi:hypothetical protein